MNWTAKTRCGAVVEVGVVKGSNIYVALETTLRRWLDRRATETAAAKQDREAQSGGFDGYGE